MAEGKEACREMREGGISSHILSSKFSKNLSKMSGFFDFTKDFFT